MTLGSHVNFHFSDLRHDYVDLLNVIMEEGAEASPRGERTRELLGVSIRIEDPVDTLPVGVGRGASPKLAALEALQLIGGYSDVEQAKRVSPHLSHFEDLGRFHGAYGPRVYPQLFAAVRRLQQDPESRRAVINVWDPVQDLLVDGVKNYPCTTQLQFMIREGKLSLFTTMRANDAWKGLAYDAWTFAQLQLTVANSLGLEPGPYFHYATSLHLYESEWEKVSGLNKGVGKVKWDARGFGIGNGEGNLHSAHLYLRDATDTARRIGGGELPLDASKSERWYWNTLEEYL